MPLPRPKSSRALQTQLGVVARPSTGEQFEKIKGCWREGGDILNLPCWQTFGFKEDNHDVVILAAPTTEPEGPCSCGAPAGKFQRWGFTRSSYVHDLPVRCRRVRVYFRQQRYSCRACGKTFQPPLSGVDMRRVYTIRLAEYIEREAFNVFRPFSAIADEVGVSETLVRDIFTASAEKRERERIISAPEWLAVDEVYLGKVAHCVISAPLSREVLDILPDNKQETLAKWLLRLPNRDRVRAVTTDMWEPYKGAVRVVLSQAKIVVDRYHVHNLLNMALKDVLQTMRDSMKPSEQRKYMRDPRLLLKSRFHLSGDGDGANQKLLVAKWIEEVPEIGKAYLLKEGISDILQLRDRGQAEGALDDWLERISNFVKEFSSEHRKSLKGWEPFSNVLITVSRWRAQILNYIDHKDLFKEFNRLRVTNAFAELVNRQIKTAYRVGNGYSYEVIRAKVVHGGILVKRRPPHPMDDGAPRIRAVRRSRKKKREAANDANVARLETSREERDDTKGLIPAPSENHGWAERFGSLDQLKLGFTAKEHKGRTKKKKGKTDKESTGPLITRTRRGTPRLKNKDQLKMF
jgi:transposase